MKRALLAFVVLPFTTGCLEALLEDRSSHAAPYCMELHETSLDLELLSIYDARSEFLYEPRFGESSWEATPCKGEDGLATGSVVHFDVSRERHAYGGVRCTPYVATFSPEPLTFTEPRCSDARDFDEASYAVDCTVGNLEGEEVWIVRQLMTPTGDFHGDLVPVELPPVLVSRTIHMGNFSASCNDVWVASLREAP